MADTTPIDRELTAIIEDALGEADIFSIGFTIYRDHAGEPALSIGVSMRSVKDIPEAGQQSKLTHKLLEALVERGDSRFPYLYFDALDMDQSPEDVDEFDPPPEMSERH